MEEQDSILLQKKMILFLSIIIVTLLFVLTFKTSLKMKKVATAIETYNKNFITVERPEEYEYVLSEQVAYMASREVSEEADTNVTDSKIEQNISTDNVSKPLALNTKKLYAMVPIIDKSIIGIEFNIK